MLSDGVHYQQAMLATQLNDTIDMENLKPNTLVKLDEVICNVVQDRRSPLADTSLCPSLLPQPSLPRYCTVAHPLLRRRCGTLRLSRLHISLAIAEFQK